MDLSAWHLWYKRRGGRQLRQLMMEEWDPIEVQGVPEALDEYDTYVGRVADRLRRGASADEVAAMLGAYRTESMELAPDPIADLAAATVIVAWYGEAMRAEGASNA